MTYLLALMTSMISARTAVMSMSALIAVLQWLHLNTMQFHCVPFGAKAVVASIPNASGRAQFGFGQFAMVVCDPGFGTEVLA